MTRKSMRLLVRLSAMLVATAAALVIAPVLYLLAAPIDLDPLRPSLARTIEGLVPGGTASIGRVMISLNPADGRLSLDVEELAIRDRAGRDAGSFERAKLELSYTALLRLTLAPRTIIIDQGTLSLTRTADGRVTLGLTPPGKAGETPGLSLTRAGQAADQPAAGPSPLAYLTRVQIPHATISFFDEPSGTTWSASDASLTLRRTRGDERLGITAAVALVGGDIRAGVIADVSTEKGAGFVTVSLKEIVPASLAAIVPDLARLSAVNAPLTGEVKITTQGPQPIQVTGEINAGAGEVVLSDLFPAPLPFGRARLNANVDLVKRQADLTRIEAEVAGVPLSGAMKLDGADREKSPGVTGSINIGAIPTAKLETLWPPNAAQGGREWVLANMADGEVSRATVTLNAQPGQLDGHVPAEAASFDFSFSGLTIFYRRPMPPVLKAQGTGKITPEKLDIAVSSGSVMDLAVSEGRVVIDDLQNPRTKADVTALVSGSLPSSLRLLDFEPLGYPSKFGLDPATTGGKAASRVSMTIPLLKDISFDDVTIKGRAELTGFSVADIGGHPLSEADAVFLVDNKGLTATGRGKVDGYESQILWKEKFSGGGLTPSHYELSATLDEAGRAKFGVDLPQYIQGPTPVKVSLEGRGARIRTGVIEADVTQATGKFELTGWEKAPGVPGLVTAKLIVEDDKSIILDQLKVTAGDLTGEGRIEISPAKELRLIDVPRVTVGDHTEATVRISRRGDGGLSYRVTAPKLDAKVLYDQILSDTGPRIRRTAYDLTADVAEATMGPNRRLGPIKVTGSHDGLVMRTMNLSATLAGGAPFDMRIDPAGPEARRLLISSPDAGAVLLVTGTLSGGEGGTLAVDGLFDDREEVQSLTGNAAIRSIRMVDVPILGQLLTLGSFSGIGDTLGGRGVLFETADIPYVSRKGVVSIMDGKMLGPNLGITLTGDIERASTGLRLQGTLAPAYTLNSLLSHVPVVGSLLSGGEGAGLVAMNYSITGPVNKPNIGVNPLSMLTPGFLRGIFDLGGPAKRSAPPVPPAADLTPGQTPKTKPKEGG